MSAESDFRALMVATGAVTALVSQRVSANRIEQGAARPFIVFSRTATERQSGLDGTIHGVRATLEVQCWADTRAAAMAVADAVVAAIDAAKHFCTSRVDGYDPDLDLESDILTIDWWES